MDIDDIYWERINWANTVADPASRKLWVEFYTNYWHTEEGQKHFQRVLERRLAGKKRGDK